MRTKKEREKTQKREGGINTGAGTVEQASKKR